MDPETDELSYTATEGKSFLVLSTGTISTPNDMGVITEMAGSQESNDDNGNPDDDAFLLDFVPSDDDTGSLLPQWQLGESDPNDKIWLSFATTAPLFTQGVAFDFAFFSSEWPTYHDTGFNDLFVVWAATEYFVGNIAVVDGLPVTNTALGRHWTTSDDPDCPADTDGPGYSCDEPQLAGTGFEGHAGTTWLRVNTDIKAEHSLELYFYLADMVDDTRATSVLLDRFRWRCEPCIPSDSPLCLGPSPSQDCCGVVVPI